MRIMKVLAKSLFTLHTCTRSLIICTSVNVHASHVNVLLAGICNHTVPTFIGLQKPIWNLEFINLLGVWYLN